MVDIIHNMGGSSLYNYDILRKAIGEGKWDEAVIEMERRGGWGDSATYNRMVKRAKYLRDKGDNHGIR